MDLTKAQLNSSHKFLGLKLNGPTIWLAYFLWFIATWTFEPPHQKEFVAAIIAFALFLPLYYDAYYKKGVRAWFAITAITVISIALATLTASASIFFVYAVKIATQSQRSVTRVAWLCCIFIAVIIPAITGHVSWYFSTGCLLFGPLVAVATATNSKLQYQAEILLKNQVEIRDLAITAERERIARDMHDTMGHVLTVVTAKSDLALRLVDKDTNQAKQEIRDINITGRQALKDVRSVIAGMENTSITNELGHCRYLLETADVHVDIANNTHTLPEHYQHALGMIIREATTNVVRHANANRCSVSLTHTSNLLTLAIKDNGNGGSFMAKTGLSSMKARADQLGGQFYIKPSTETGTDLIVTVPLESNEPK